MPRPDYSRFLTETAQLRQPGMHALAKLLRAPGMRNVAGGLPNARAFPFKGFSFETDAGETIRLTDDETRNALQYSETEGLPQFVAWCRAHQQRLHSPPYADYDICVATGSQDALVRAFEALINRGDHVILDKFTYPAVLSALRPLQPTMHAMPVDAHGMVPEALAELLDNWDANTPKPKFIYIVPVGHNPLGHTMPLERKRAIYALASKHDILIFEDDPYFHLEFGPPGTEPSLTTPVRPPPSFFSLDVDQRVLRFDSFSKTLSAGLRLGWVTGPKPLVERIMLHIQISALQPCGLSQTVLVKMLEHWGDAGFDAHIAQTQALYRSQRDICVAAARKHLGDLVKFNAPSAGMFLWMELPPHVNTSELFDIMAKRLVMITPGKMFAVDGLPNNFLRISFSQANEQIFDEAFAILAEVVASIKP